MTISKLLELSTAHLSQETAQLLGEDPISPDVFYSPLIVYAFDYGWIVSAPEQDEPSIPRDLAQIFAYAKTQDCRRVMFDRDADILSNLPTFDW